MVVACLLAACEPEPEAAGVEFVDAPTPSELRAARPARDAGESAPHDTTPRCTSCDAGPRTP